MRLYGTILTASSGNGKRMNRHVPEREPIITSADGNERTNAPAYKLRHKAAYCLPSRLKR